jgi:hypothetical protein
VDGRPKTWLVFACASALCCARGAPEVRPPSISFELEAASMDTDAPDGGVPKRRPPEDRVTRTAFGLALQVVDDPIRACGRTRAHPADGSARLMISVDAHGRVVDVAKVVTPGMEAVAACIEEVVKGVEFPSSDRAHRVRFESRFETQR